MAAVREIWEPLSNIFMISIEERLRIAARTPAINRGDQPTSDAPDLTLGNTSEEQSRNEQIIVDLITQQEREVDIVRRDNMRRYLELEQFWRGNHWGIWSETAFNYLTPAQWANSQGQSEDSLPRRRWTTNMFQSFGLAVIAACGQRIPKVRWEPVDTEDDADIATSRAASNIARLVERNNKLNLLSIKEAYLGWTQGMYGSYTRYVVDKKFKTHLEPVVEMVEKSTDYLHCSHCLTDIPLTNVPEILKAKCPNCGNPLGPEDYVPGEPVEVPEIVGYEPYPNGREVISIYGAMNIKVMPQANALDETLYLGLCEERPRSAIRAAYPVKADRIEANQQGAEDQFERIVRLQLVGGQGRVIAGHIAPFQSLVTYKRFWMRPELFYDLGAGQQDLRDRLLKAYPDGCRVDLAGDEILAIRAENMDDHWALCMPMPGQGAYREPWGWSCLDSQKQLNHCENVIAEQAERGSAPPVFANAEYVNIEAIKGKPNEPASIVGVKMERGGARMPMSELMWQPKIMIDANIYQRRTELIGNMQQLANAPNAMRGVGEKHLDTAGAYRQALNQSIGVYMILWEQTKEFHCDTMTLAVECFRKNRTEDTKVNVFQEASGRTATEYIRLDELQGSVNCVPESDEGFPSTWPEIVDRILTMTKTIPAEMTALMNLPANAPLARKVIGVPELYLPLEKAREKQYREIDILLTQQAVGPDQNGLMIPSIRAEIWMDDHAAEMATIREWSEGAKGIEARKSSPLGFANVQAHLIDHVVAMDIQQAQQAKIQQTVSLKILGPPPVPPGTPTGTPGAPTAPGKHPVPAKPVGGTVNKPPASPATPAAPTAPAPPGPPK